MGYIEKIDKHALLKAIENYENTTNAIDKENLNELQMELLARSNAIVDMLKKIFVDSDKNYLSESWIRTVKDALANLEVYIKDYCNSGSSSHYNSCEQCLDTILENIAKMNGMKDSGPRNTTSLAFEQYAKTMTDKMQLFYSTVQETKNEIALIQSKRNEFEAVCDNKIEEYTIKLNAEQQRLDNFSNLYTEQMNADKTNFTVLTNEFRNQFSESQTQNKAEFDESANTFRNFQNDSESNIKQKLQQFDDEQVAFMSECKGKFDSYENEVKNIVGIINTNMFSHKYKEVADNSQKRAKIWHIVAVSLMVIVSAFATFAFVITSNQDTTWVQLVSKIFATTTLATGAAYAARQASKQEKVERYARKIEMEMVSIDAFIESMDEDRRAQIKEEVAKKIFGNPNALEINEKAESYVPLDNLTEIIKDAINTNKS